MADIDHRTMTPPSLRVVKSRDLDAGDTLRIWDFRIAQPNVSHVSMPVVHSIEHFLGSYFAEHEPRVVAVAPMGCQTGFYIVTLNVGTLPEISRLIVVALSAIETAVEVPLANVTDCGWAENHSLPGAQALASWLLSRSDTWHESSIEMQ